jgi:Tetratricopeptide repeat
VSHPGKQATRQTVSAAAAAAALSAVRRMFVNVKTTIASNAAAVPNSAASSAVNTTMMILNRSSSSSHSGGGGGDRKSLLVDGDHDDDDHDDQCTTVEESSQHSSSLRGGGGGGITSNTTSSNRPRTYSDDGDTNKRGMGAVGGVVNGVKNGVVGGVVGRGSKAVVGSVVGGSKAVVGGVVGGSKAVVDGVVGGSRAVVDGVNQSATTITKGATSITKGVVGGVNQSATTLTKGATTITKGVDGVLNRSAKKVDDFANLMQGSANKVAGSANKVVGGVVGVGTSVVGSVVGTSTSLLLNLSRATSSTIKEEEGDEHHQQQQDATDPSESESGHTTRSLKRATSGQSVKTPSGGSNRNLLSALLSSQSSEKNSGGRGDGDGDRSVATTKTAASKNNKQSRRMSSAAALVRAPSIQEMGYGSQDDTADPSLAKKLSRRRSAFGAAATTSGYCSNEEKPGTTTTASTSTSSSTTAAKGKTSGAEIISGKMGGCYDDEHVDDEIGYGYGDSEDDTAAMMTGLKKKVATRRRSVFGAMTGGGYCSSEEKPQSLLSIGKRSGAEIISSKMGSSSRDVISSHGDDNYDMGYDAAAPTTTTVVKKKVGRRRSAFGAVSGGYCSSEDNPAKKAGLEKSSSGGADITSGKKGRSGKSRDDDDDDGGGGGGAVSSDDDMGYGDEADAMPRSPNKKKVGRRRSAFGAITGGYASSDDDEMNVGRPGAVTRSPKKASKSGDAVCCSSVDGMGYGDAAPLPPKANKAVSRRRASAFGGTGGGYCSFDEEDLRKDADRLAPIDEPLGHSSCHGDGDVVTIRKEKRMGRRKSAFGAVPGGFVAENNNAIQFNPNSPTNLVQFIPNSSPAATDMAANIPVTTEEQDGKQSSSPAITNDSPPPTLPKTPKVCNKSKEEEHDECSSPVAAASPTLKSPKKESKPPKKSKTPKKTKASDGATEDKSPKSAKLAEVTVSPRRKMVKLTKEEVEGLGDLGQQEISETSGKKVIRVKRRAGTKVTEANGANAVAAMGGTAAETTTTQDGRTILKFKVKRKDKVLDNEADCDNKSVGGRPIGGTLNPMNLFKKNSGDGAFASPSKTKKSTVGGMFKLRTSNEAIGMSPRSLKSVSGREDDDKSVRSVRSAATNRTTKTAKSSAGRVLARAKSWFKSPVAGGNARKPDEYGCFDDTTASGIKSSFPNIADDNLAIPSSETRGGGGYSGPPLEIFTEKSCSAKKRQPAPLGRAAIIQKQWLAGGTNFNQSIMAAGTSHDDSDSDTSADNGPEGDMKDDAADDVSEVSFDELPIRTIPVHFSAGAHQSTEVEFWKHACEERTKRYGTKHRLTADAFVCKGSAELCEHDYKAAVKSLSKGVSYLQLIYGGSHPCIAHGLHLLGAAACFSGQLKLAEESTLNAFEMRRNALGVCHVDTIDSFANLGMVYFKMDNLPEAGRIFSELVQLRTAVFGKPHPSIAFANRALAQVFVRMSELKKAQKYYVKALKTFDKLEMIGDLNETEAEMTKFGIEIPLKEKEESTATATVVDTTAAAATSVDPGQQPSTKFAV